MLKVLFYPKGRRRSRRKRRRKRRRTRRRRKRRRSKSVRNRREELKQTGVLPSQTAGGRCYDAITNTASVP